jgi:hypothetical protein
MEGCAATARGCRCRSDMLGYSLFSVASTTAAWGSDGSSARQRLRLWQAWSHGGRSTRCRDHVVRLLTSATSALPACCRWQEQFVAAKTSLEDREDKVMAASELIEKDLRLLGCTAIEDKLQEGVPEAIATLAAANIRLWVLTGAQRLAEHSARVA